MKKDDVQIQFQQLISSFLLTVLFCVCALSLFSQVNPWKNPSKENPWENASKENPWENKTNSESKPINLNTDSTAKINTEPKNINTNIDSAIISSNTDSSALVSPTYTELSLKSIERISRNEYKANAAFIGSFISGGLFLIYALPVNMLISLIPTKRVDSYVANYKKQLNNPSKEQIKAVKKGIQKKRSLKSLGGSLVGMGTGLAFWLILLNL
jgi:hypothetical protein